MNRKDYPTAPADTPEWVFWLLNEIEYDIQRLNQRFDDDVNRRFDAVDEALAKAD